MRRRVRVMPLDRRAKGRDRRPARRDPADPPRHRAGARGDPLRSRSRCSTTASSGSSTTWATTRRWCRRRASPTARAPSGSARIAGLIQLSDAAPAHDAVRDVRDQVPREAADLRGAAVDPAPHRQRERILRALLDPRQRVLLPAPEQLAAQSTSNRQGRGDAAGRRGGRSACSTCCATTRARLSPTTPRC